MAVGTAPGFEGGAIIATTDGGSTWVGQTVPSEAGLSLETVSCPSTSECLAVGFPNVVIATTDRGSTWVGQTVPSGVDSLAGISCGSTSSCAAVGRYAIIATTNGGTTWMKQRVPKGIPNLAAVSCPSPSSCTAVGENPQSGAVIVGSTAP